MSITFTTQQREKRRAAEAKERHETAIHEAGHAVVGQELGYRVSEVSLRAGGGGNCFLSIKPRDDTLVALERELSFVLAGRLAVALARGEDVEATLMVLRAIEVPRGVLSLVDVLTLESPSTGKDYRDYVEAAADLLDGREISGYRWLDDALPDAAGRAWSILAKRWEDVESLACSLEAEGRVDVP